MKNLFSAAVITIGLLLPLSAWAGSGYVGAGIGQAHAEISSPADFGENDSGFKLYGGYQFQKYLATELFYLQTHEIGRAEQPGWSSVKVSGSGVGVLGIYPLSDTVGVFAKLGLFRWSTDLNVNVLGTVVTTTDDGTDLGFGFGLLAQINDRFTLRIETETYDVQFKNPVGTDLDGKVRLLSFGAMYRF